MKGTIIAIAVAVAIAASGYAGWRIWSGGYASCETDVREASDNLTIRNQAATIEVLKMEKDAAVRRALALHDALDEAERQTHETDNDPAPDAWQRVFERMRAYSQTDLGG